MKDKRQSQPKRDKNSLLRPVYMRDVGLAINLSDAVSKEDFLSMEQHSLKNVNNCLNTNIYSYLETSGEKKI